MSRKRTRAPSPELHDIVTGIFRSEEVQDRDSVFVGVFSASLPAEALQKLPDFKTATHRIAAWRKQSRQKSIIPNAPRIMEARFDDDGEGGAGRRLMKVLEDEGVEGSFVVARWYGGTLLGPVRFTHVETVAKQALSKWVEASEEAKRVEDRKKLKMEEETALQELRDSLRQRDQSILILRESKATKAALLADTDRAPPTPSRKPPDYDTMGKEALERMEKARDATLSFIIGDLAKLDEQLREAGKLEVSGGLLGVGTDPIANDKQTENAPGGTSHMAERQVDGSNSIRDSLHPLIDNSSTTNSQQAEDTKTEKADSLGPPIETKSTAETTSFQNLSFSETMTWVDTPESSLAELSSQAGSTKQAAD